MQRFGASKKPGLINRFGGIGISSQDLCKRFGFKLTLICRMNEAANFRVPFADERFPSLKKDYSRTIPKGRVRLVEDA